LDFEDKDYCCVVYRLCLHVLIETGRLAEIAERLGKRDVEMQSKLAEVRRLDVTDWPLLGMDSHLQSRFVNASMAPLAMDVAEVYLLGTPQDMSFAGGSVTVNWVAYRVPVLEMSLNCLLLAWVFLTVLFGWFDIGDC
jgi:hypothetical protein